MEYLKYPRTYHLPYSKGYTQDNKVLTTDDCFLDITIYKDFYQARSLDSSHRDYHSWFLGYMKEFQYTIPDRYRVCGEYLYARLSITYNHLSSNFMVFLYGIMKINAFHGFAFQVDLSAYNFASSLALYIIISFSGISGFKILNNPIIANDI
ncbi:hypothetical protein [Hungatella hathewayi]|uniref:hypothetical protein n=1 Tax=Hungatella hathewayi TaxID=154046 RepID=UPI003561F998